MVQIIDVPGQGQIEFPDEMSDEDITRAIQVNFGTLTSDAPAPPGLEGIPPPPGGVPPLHELMPDMAKQMEQQAYEQRKDPNAPSGFGSFGRGVEQGITFNLADEAKAGLGALYAKALGGEATSDMSIGDLYSQALAEQNKQLQRDLQENAASAIAGNLAGGVAGGLGAAATKGGAAIVNSLRSGGGWARAGKAGLAGALSGAAYGAGGAAEGERMQGAGEGAVTGGLFGAGLSGAGTALSKLNTKTIIPNSDEIKAAASKLYKQAEQYGGMLKPQFTNQFLEKAEKALLTDDALINSMRSNAPMRAAMEDLAAFKNQPMTLTRAQALDEQLGNMVDEFVDAKGNIMKQGKKLLDVQRNFRNMIENADEAMFQGGKEGFEALKEGRKLWATSRRLNDIERIIENAETYQVPATAIKSGFRRLANSSKILGYSPEEVKAIKRAANTGVATDIMATFGSRLGALVGASQGAAGAALGYGASTAARAGATASQMKRAADAARLVAERSGMVTQQQRLQSPEFMRALMLLPPGQAKKILDEAQN